MRMIVAQNLETVRSRPSNGGEYFEWRDRIAPLALTTTCVIGGENAADPATAMSRSSSDQETTALLGRALPGMAGECVENPLREFDRAVIGFR